MYPEITSRIRAIEEALNSPNFYHIDQRLEKVLDQLRSGVEFLAKKVYALEHKDELGDPHRYIPGIDD